MSQTSKGFGILALILIASSPIDAAPVTVFSGADAYLVADNGIVSGVGTAGTAVPVDTNTDHYSEPGLFAGQDIGQGDSWNGDRRWGNDGLGTAALYDFTDLTAGNYNIYASWRNPAQGNLGLARYQVSDGGPTIDIDQSVGATALSALVLNDGLRNVDFALIGSVTVSDGTLQVYVDDSVTGTDANTFIFSDAIAIGPIDATPPPMDPPARFNGDVIAYQVNAPQAGFQDFSGSGGMDFDVTEAVWISALGAFDADQDGMNLDITVELWQRDNAGTADEPADDSGVAILASEIFTSNDPGTLVGATRFKSLSDPLLLEPGSYTINAYGYGPGELFGNSSLGAIGRRLNGEGVIDFVGSSRYCFDGGPCTDFPPTPDAGGAAQYAAGSFAFSPVPEPGSSTLLIWVFGWALLGLRRQAR
ncbi:MAG: hypothetical protein KDA60_14575 [Planctomycetales bacterium]|nr:hypothetical protein [Planctomycetales bacterium]